MKLILFLVFSCLAVHNGKGAPASAVYKFLRCNPEGDKANCVTMQSPEMNWSPELPRKLPASTARHLEAEPVEDDSPQGEDEQEEETLISEGPMSDEGSGGFEGSGYDMPFLGDRAIETAEGETGSGEDWTEKDSRSVAGEAKPAEQELREESLLQP